MDEIPFSVRVILGRATLTKEEYFSLEKGDVLLLNQKIEEKLEVEVGTVTKMWAAPCLQNGVRQIKVERIV